MYPVIHSLALFLPAIWGVSSYPITDNGGIGPLYRGIGGLSGGGATSRLLPDYPPEVQQQIYDYLFLPNFGASLQLLKVEIGSGGQSTEGTEACHQYTANASEASFERGYEWLLLRESKKRNPDIGVWALSWAWPAWVGCPGGDLTSPDCDGATPWKYPEQTAAYTVSFIQGAAELHNVTIDVIGSWNERSFNSTYLVALRAALNSAGLSNTKITCDDFNWQCAVEMMKPGEEALLAAVDFIGGHDVQKPEDQLPGKPMVDSEGYHTTGSDEGASSWIQELNTRYIDYNQTANLAWNLITAYLEGTAFWPHGLMHAFMPWSGWYTVPATIWATAHYTQFTSIATPWFYTKVGSGSGYLTQGGSYVSLLCPSTGDWTLVIEKMPGPGTVEENVPFTLGGGFFPNSTTSHPTAAVWSTLLSVGTQYAGPSQQFQRLLDVNISSGTFSIPIQVGQIITVTTLVGAGSKGEYPPSSPPAAFPSTYADDFNSCLPFAEAKYVTDFNGVMECEDSGDPAHGMVMKQKVAAAPIRWWADTRPHSVIGDVSWEDTTFSIDFRCTPNTVSGLEGSAMVGVRASLQGRDGPDGIHAEDELPGLWFAVSCGATPAPWQVAAAVKDIGTHSTVATGTLPFPLPTGTWHTLTITANGTQGSAWVDGTLAFSKDTTTIPGLPLSGWAGFGTISFGDFTQFDNLAVTSSSARCSAANGVGGAVALWPCNAGSPAQHFTFTPVAGGGGFGSLSLTSYPTLCVAVSTEKNQYGSNVVELAFCNTTQGAQLWTLGEEGNVITKGVLGAEVCLDVTANVYSPGAQLDVYGCQNSGNQRWVFDKGLLSIGDPAGFFCAGSCK